MILHLLSALLAASVVNSQKQDIALGTCDLQAGCISIEVYQDNPSAPKCGGDCTFSVCLRLNWDRPECTVSRRELTYSCIKNPNACVNMTDDNPFLFAGRLINWGSDGIQCQAGKPGEVVQFHLFDNLDETLQTGGCEDPTNLELVASTGIGSRAEIGCAAVGFTNSSQGPPTACPLPINAFDWSLPYGGQENYDFNAQTDNIEVTSACVWSVQLPDCRPCEDGPNCRFVPYCRPPIPTFPPRPGPLECGLNSYARRRAITMLVLDGEVESADLTIRSIISQIFNLGGYYPVILIYDDPAVRSALEALIATYVQQQLLPADRACLFKFKITNYNTPCPLTADEKRAVYWMLTAIEEGSPLLKLEYYFRITPGVEVPAGLGDVFALTARYGYDQLGNTDVCEVGDNFNTVVNCLVSFYLGYVEFSQGNSTCAQSMVPPPPDAQNVAAIPDAGCQAYTAGFELFKVGFWRKAGILEFAHWAVKSQILKMMGYGFVRWLSTQFFNVQDLLVIAPSS